MTDSGPLKKTSNFLECIRLSFVLPFPKKSQNSATSENIITDPLSPDSITLMNGHDACTISFYLMGEKKPTFPSFGPKKRKLKN